MDQVPIPLWYDPDPRSPAIGMTMVPGTHLDSTDVSQLKALATTHTRLQQLPLHGLLAETDRIDSAAHYIHRLTTIWPQQLAQHRDDPLTADMFRLLTQWDASGDRQLLSEPAEPVFSRGDANLLNWLWDDGTIGCVDFEFAGRSAPAFDAADLIEHISARSISDETWHTLIPELGVDHSLIKRFRAAQRTTALRWLAVLWKQRHRRKVEFAAQLTRVRGSRRPLRCPVASEGAL
ncbi:aminoglycoside phosphotransferase family protein [Spongiactinospora rosea]|uniref:Aminoglycoside phosphotransferase family protein n=1 Tax=Spongiactinospora rosea TaxID=2248750 RepID=A0A366LF82_9ACTN|nr:aminoglycoside phosphotransferase family protein [Spongiactinospora rosea]